MGDFNQQLAALIEDVTTVFGAAVFGLLAFYGAGAWIRSREPATAWFGGMFAAIGLALGIGVVVPDITVDQLLGRVSVALLALFPYLLYRFTQSFAHTSRVFDIATTLLTLVVVGWSFGVALPEAGEMWSGSAAIFLVVFVCHWMLLSALSAFYFIREARSAPGVSGRRMRLFAIATGALAIAILIAGVSDGTSSVDATALIVTVIMQGGGALAAVLFWFALAPPRWLRAGWRARELNDVVGGLRELLEGETIVEVHERTLDAALRLSGGTGVVLCAAGSVEPIAWEGIDRVEAEEIAAATSRRRARHPQRSPRYRSGGIARLISIDRIIVACGPTMPFFGADERGLLGMISAFATLAEERAETLERERDANERLRQIDQLKTEFVAMVAHDLRTPMAVISGFADTIHDRWTDLDDAHKLEYLQLISRNTHSLAQFVDDVLQVARMESGELHYEMEPFDARLVVSRIVHEMQVTHPELTLTVDAPAVLPAALGDVDRNWQILNNLVGNALKFSPSSDPRIEVLLREMPDEQSVSIAVRDRGVGIASEDLPRLFRRFSRVGATRRTVAGSGLGLYIVKSMVEAQGGRIWVQSTPGEGSTFTYTIPIARDEATI
ncbi:MAG: ATP-binding protein [Gaiellales bacterium]